MDAIRSASGPWLAGLPAIVPLGTPDVAEVVGRMRAAGADPWAEVGDVPSARRAAAAGASLWVRGLEAGGPCGEVGALVLIRVAHASGRPFVVQGLGRRAMAAALAVGAAGVVLDVHLWGLDGSPVHPDHLRALVGRSGRDTQVTDGVRSARGTAVLPDWPTDPTSAVPAPQCLGELEHSSGGLQAFVDALRADLEARVQRARRTHPLRADPLGTGRCVVQGPMANVAEAPGLARVVRAAGGLPSCALGALRPDAADAVLQGMGDVPEPWGAGVIGFDVMPFRDAHLDALDAVRSSPPRPVILAGGSPQLAASVEARGHAAWLHTPSARLARMALGRGVSAVILEGREAGGHIGALTSSGLWEECLAACEQADVRALIVLAGGIGDPVTAAFAGAMGADAHALGHRIALQVGTALFFTHEIVEHGQITRAYQQAALAADRTVAVGATVDLPLQCAPNAFTRDAIANEHGWADAGVPLAERRERVEHHNLGRTRLAAKGIERDGQGGHRAASVQRQRDEGAFTMGQGACATDDLQTVQELFRSLTDGAADLLEGRAARRDRWGPVRRAPGAPTRRDAPRPASSVDPQVPIAIVGMGCVLPGAPDLPAYWELLVHGLDAVRPIPAERWRPDRYFDPDGDGTTTQVRMAGLVRGFRFDPIPFGIPPRVVPSLDRAQQLALVAAAEAVRGVRIRDRRRAAVILGNSMGGEHAKSLAVRVRFREVLHALDADGALGTLDDEGLDRVSEALEARLDGLLPPVDVESMSGLLGNVIAGRIAGWLDLQGGNLTVDAACAASLSALVVAVDQLRAGRVDLVLTGGVDADLAPETYVGFDRTHALSSTGSRPFAAGADGFVMGEGAAVLACKRLPDALADGDRIWAVVRGVGQSSDGRSTGITAPRAEGQRLAIERAWDGLSPADVGMVEAHGTGTPLGDRTEVSVLARWFAGRRVALGSVKSQIGHLKGGAGAASLVKAALAVAHGVVPPTLHAAPARAEVRDGPFVLPRTPLPFPDGLPRACVSAFGFGGTNVHAVLEAPPEDRRPPRLPVPSVPAASWDHPVPEVRLFGAADPGALLEAFDAGHTVAPEELPGFPERLAVIGDPPGLRAWVAQGAIGPFGRLAWRDRGAVEPVVLVFPGQGSVRAHADGALRRIPSAAATLRALGVHTLDTGDDPAAQHHLLVACGAAWSAALDGLAVAGVIGHSVGELSALVAAGRLDPADALRLADVRGAALGTCPEGAMLAVALPAGDAHAFGAADGLAVAARNGPSSTVLAGAPDAVRAARERARAAGVRGTILEVRRAFHTPDVEPASRALAAGLRDVTLRPGLPWWSNVGPVDDDGVARALVDAVTAPVGFLDAVRRAADAGHRRFVHVGPGAALVPHLAATVPDARILAVDPHPSEDADGLVPGAAELAAWGHPSWLRSLPGTLVTLPFPTAPMARIRGGTPAAVRRPARRAPRPPVDRNRPAPAAPPATGARAVLLEAIAEVTGYPPEAVQPGASLDRDLGIDSIRKMEVLGLVQERLGVAVDDDALSRVAGLDVDGLVALLEGAAPPSAVAPVAAGRWVRAPRLGAPTAPATVEDAPLDVLVTPWLDGGTPCAGVVLDPSLPAHHGLAALLAVRSREGAAPVDVRWSRELSWVAAPALDGEPLPPDPVVVATGGTSGILGPCLRALEGARGVVLSRAGTCDVPGFTGVPCDVTDAGAVRAAVDACRARHGRIDVVIHAAGVLRDGPLAERSADDVSAVLGAKVDGAHALIDATLQDAPAVFAPFGSVAATLANPGQALYAAANATLEALVHPTARRTVPLVWTAWSGRGMAADPSLQRLLRSRGIAAIDPSTGAELFARALTGSGRQWLAAEPPPDPGLPWPLSAWDGLQRFAVDLDPADPLLTDHTVGGRPLVPAALWVGAMFRAIGLVRTGPFALSSVEVLAPTFVGRPTRAFVHVDADRVRVERAGSVVCRARIARAAEPPGSAPTALPTEPADGLYTDGLLFHGPSWRMLTDSGVRGERASAHVHLNGTDPLATVVDGAHQLLATWSGRSTGSLGLPVGAGSWSVHGPLEPTRGPVRLELSARAVEGGVVGQVLALDPDGRPVLTGSDVRLRDAGRWRSDG